MGKVILVLMDGLNYRTMTETASYFEQLVENQLAAKYRIRTEMPTTSRPLYETVLTGLPPHRHGIVSCAHHGPSRCENLFSLTTKQGRVNAAAAYSWVSELYCTGQRFDMNEDRYHLSGEGQLQYGIFYGADRYPDNHVVSDGEYLRRTYHPDFLFLHTMAPDDTGHKFGSESQEYRSVASSGEDLISTMLAAWQEDGYDVLVTADHGMNAYRMHGGISEDERTVGLYLFSNKAIPGDYSDHTISQLNVAPLVCRLMGISPGDEMISPDEVALVPGCGK